MTTCAVFQLSDGLVINMIVADPTDLPPDGCQLILADGVVCDIGWTWDGTQFVAPVVEIVPPIEEIVPPVEEAN